MKQDVEKKIIDAARELFYEKGFTGATIRDIAGKAEVNLALLHYYFRTKENIFKTVFNEAFTLLFRKLNSALSSDVDLFEKIRLIVSCYITTATKYPKLASFIMHELSVNADFVYKCIYSNEEKEDVNTNYEKFFQEVIDAGENGTIKKVDPKILFTDIMSLSLFPFVGSAFLTHFLYSGKNTRFNKAIKDRTDHICELIIKSLQT